MRPLDPLAFHLQRWAEAYGADLVLPLGIAAPRAAPVEAPTATGGPPAESQRLRPASPEPRRPQPGASAPARGEPRAPAPPPRPEAAVDATRESAPRPAPPPAAPTPRSLPPAPPSAPLPPAAADEREAALAALRDEVRACTACKLHQGRTHAVPGEGNARARVMFVGEAPGHQEDLSGRPFVGAAGQLLERILTGAMGLQRSEVFIANVNKCRPPNNRDPQPDEVAACLPFLRRQVEIVRPEVIVCLGRVAAHNLLATTESTTRLRGKVHDYHGTRVVVTWHPAYLLREPGRKRETWDDIKLVNRLLGLPEVPRDS